MKKSKRLLTMLLAVAMILTFMPAMAFADEPDLNAVSVVGTNYSSSSNKYDDSVFDAAVNIDAANPATIDYNIKSNILMSRNTHEMVRFVFNFSGDANTNWNGCVIDTDFEFVNPSRPADQTIKSGQLSAQFGVNISEIEAAFADTAESKGIIKKYVKLTPAAEGAAPTVINVVIDVNNLSLFKYNTGLNTKNVTDMILWTDGDLHKCDYPASVEGYETLNNNNKLSWLLMKSEDLAGAIHKDVETVGAVDGALADAQKAVATPGQAAVDASAKAVAAVAAAKTAQGELGTLVNEADAVYISNAKTFADSCNPEKVSADLVTKAAGNATDLTNGTVIANQDPAILNDAGLAANDLYDKAVAEKAAADVAALKYTPEKAKIKSVSPSKKKAVVRFKKISKNVTGYEVRVIDKKTGKVVKTVKAKKSKKSVIKKTVKGLKKNTKYKAQVRAYNTAGGKTYYGKWSKSKSFKTKK